MVPVKAAYFTTEINENTEKINRRRRTMDPPQCHSGRSVTETRNPSTPVIVRSIEENAKDKAISDNAKGRRKRPLWALSQRAAVKTQD